jgi:Predicted sugar nucleotidyltransferases
MMSGISRTVIISCAGMGSRLGFGCTKALVEVEGKSLLARHLELLAGVEDVRVVVGYQSERVMEEARKYRSDVKFVFNHRYRETKTGVSVSLAAQGARDYVLTLDGDILVHPQDMEKALSCGHEFVSGGVPASDDPWMLQAYVENGREFVSAFSKEDGVYEWNGITQMASGKMQHGTGHVFQMAEPHLPLPFLELRTREIDTANDYERAVRWVKNGFADK